MEQDQADTENNNNQHEILPEAEPSEKTKKAHKPKATTEAKKAVSATIIEETDPEALPEQDITPADSEETSQDSADDNIEDQPIPEIEQKDQEEDETATNDEPGDSTDISSTDGIVEEITDENDIPPIKQIRNLLTDFEMRVPVWGLTVFTVDGYILAHRLFYDGMPDNLEMVVSSMSAGLITISQDFIRLVASNSMFRQVIVDADDESGKVGFSIMLKHIAENVMLTCIFPSAVKLGLVSFEIENLSNDINEIVGLWDVKLHEETVT